MSQYRQELGLEVKGRVLLGLPSSKTNKELIAYLDLGKKINEIIVGYPIHMDGTVGVRAKEVDIFIKVLEKAFKIPIHRVDERLTSLAAEEAMGKQSAKKKKQNLGKIDASAAGLILRDFIENRNIIPPP